MKISLDIIESNQEIYKRILDAMKPELNRAFAATSRSLQKKISALFKDALLAEPEYNSLLSSTLKYELGIPDAASRIESLFDHWVNNMVITNKPITIKGNGFSGGFSIDMIKTDFSDVIDLPASTVVDDISGSVIPWLQWLLLEGGKILVRQYIVKYGPNQRSRTDNAIMISSSQNNWRVPAAFAGTINDNWITRAISRLDNSMYDLIEKELENNL